MSTMLVVVLHPCTEFEVTKPPHSEDMADFRSRVTRVMGLLLPICSYALPFSTYSQARDRQTERQTVAINA